MSLEIGSSLGELLAAQQDDDDALLYPSLQAYAGAVAELCQRLRSPMVWPVGPTAERLAGAAVVESCGGVRLRGWNDDLSGERVLLLAGAAVTPLGLYAAAEQARRLGVSEVMAAGIRVAGVEARGSIDHFFPLEAASAQRRRTA